MANEELAPVEETQPDLMAQLQRYVQLQAEIEQHVESSPELSELLAAIRSGEGWFDFTRLL